MCSPAAKNGDSQTAHDVEVFDQSRSPTLAEIRDPERMPLPLSSLQNVAPAVFEKWFSSTNDQGSVYQLLIETLPPNDLTLDTTLLRLAQAVEVFYRRMIKETYVTPQEFDSYYEAMVKAFPADMPEDLRSRLASYLEHGNEYSLKSVVKRLLNDLDEPARKALGIENSTEFSLMVANTRNPLTHLTTPDGPVASTAREYYEMNQRLRALLYGVLAKSLGFDARALEQCVLKVRTYA